MSSGQGRARLSESSEGKRTATSSRVEDHPPQGYGHQWLEPTPLPHRDRGNSMTAEMFGRNREKAGNQSRSLSPKAQNEVCWPPTAWSMLCRDPFCHPLSNKPSFKHSLIEKTRTRLTPNSFPAPDSNGSCRGPLIATGTPLTILAPPNTAFGDLGLLGSADYDPTFSNPS